MGESAQGSVNQERIRGMPRYASSGFSSGVVKVLVSFYRSREDSAFERHRSKVTFDLSKQSSVAAVKKHLREFLGLNELALYFRISPKKNSVVSGHLR